MIWLSLCLSWIYWIYLGTNTQMVLAQDALSYDYLGRQILENGFFNHYFTSGPNREPVYPLLVAFSMQVGLLSGIASTKVLAFLGVVILICNQLCLWRILQILKIRPIIIAFTLLYLGISPAINNGAFSLYSEIATYPFILPLILVSHYYHTSIQHVRNNAILFAILQGIILVCLTLVKASFEVIAPVFLVSFNMYTWYKNKQELSRVLCCAFASLLIFFCPIITYKLYNKQYNDHFAITDRASWALYGNTARRMEPLNQERLLSAIAYVPGEGSCRKFFTIKACDFWSFTQSDDFGMTKAAELKSKLLSEETINHRLLQATINKTLLNPLQYAILTALEALKMFFWESTQIGFVAYPLWLTKIYGNVLFKDILRLIVSLCTIFAVFFMYWRSLQRNTPPLIVVISLLSFLYISTYAFFFILTRYALPLAPLFLIAIAYAANFLYNDRHAKH